MNNLELKSETRHDKVNRYISQLERHIEKAEDHKKYSSDRFDILCISISTTALIFSIGFVKDIIKDFEHINVSVLKTAWLLLSLTIMFNFISQFVSFYANDYEIQISKSLLKKKRGSVDKTDVEKLEKRCRNLSVLTIGLNWASLVTIIIGIAMLVFFFSNNL